MCFVSLFNSQTFRPLTLLPGHKRQQVSSETSARCTHSSLGATHDVPTHADEPPKPTHTCRYAPKRQETPEKTHALFFQLITTALADLSRSTRLATFPFLRLGSSLFLLPIRFSLFTFPRLRGRPHSSRPAPTCAAHFPRHTQDASCTWPRLAHPGTS